MCILPKLLNVRNVIQPRVDTTVVLLATVILFSIVAVPTTAAAQGNDTFNFQGSLTDPGGNPLNTTTSMTFKLYQGGIALWTEPHASVEVSDGLFEVVLGSVTSLDTLGFDGPLELGIKVGSGPELAPKVPLRNAARALSLRGLRVDPAADALQGPNLIGGWRGNTVSSMAIGATISGGNGNRAIGHQSTISGGGTGNVAGDSTGASNDASFATVGGGYQNRAKAHHSSIGGGDHNLVTGVYGVVPGGLSNVVSSNSSFAAGRNAIANHDFSFVWNGAGAGSLTTTAASQFLIGATGGVGIGTASPDAQLHVTTNDIGVSSGFTAPRVAPGVLALYWVKLTAR